MNDKKIKNSITSLEYPYNVQFDGDKKTIDMICVKSRIALEAYVVATFTIIDIRHNQLDYRGNTRINYREFMAFDNKDEAIDYARFVFPEIEL
ncbi:hypothetical protein ACFVRU_56010 [Streptomyces sp. NPDC057927]